MGWNSSTYSRSYVTSWIGKDTRKGKDTTRKSRRSTSVRTRSIRNVERKGAAAVVVAVVAASKAATKSQKAKAAIRRVSRTIRYNVLTSIMNYVLCIKTHPR